MQISQDWEMLNTLITNWPQKKKKSVSEKETVAISCKLNFLVVNVLWSGLAPVLWLVGQRDLQIYASRKGKQGTPNN